MCTGACAAILLWRIYRGARLLQRLKKETTMYAKQPQKKKKGNQNKKICGDVPDVAVAIVVM